MKKNIKIKTKFPLEIALGVSFATFAAYKNREGRQLSLRIF